jgi:hypothetical protein
MTTIEIQVQDDLVNQFGVDVIRRMVSDELAYQQFRLLETSMQNALQQAEGVDWTQEFEAARQEAFADHQRRWQPNA